MSQWTPFHYPRIQQTFHLSDKDIADVWEEIRRRVFFTEGLYNVFAVERNTSDNVFLACALEAGADYLVSQDAHLRDLKYYHGTQIIGWTQLLALLSL
jgi:predicted nucleic acid-binding protein